MNQTHQQDPDGVWRQSIPLPFYGWRLRLRSPIYREDTYRCFQCATDFTTEQAYRDHYRSDHPYA